jgi:hypothetical protein
MGAELQGPFDKQNTRPISGMESLAHMDRIYSLVEGRQKSTSDSLVVRK